MAKIFITAGIVFLVTGAVLLILEGNHLKYLSWFGNLPGDIKIEKKNFRFYFPLTSMLLISIILSLIIRILKKYF